MLRAARRPMPKVGALTYDGVMLICRADALRLHADAALYMPQRYSSASHFADDMLQRFVR